MKVVTPQQMSEMERKAYDFGLNEESFMDAAGLGVANVVDDFVNRIGLERNVVLLCGKGNNAGDTYVAGIQLMEYDYHVVAFQTVPIEECSNLCQKNYRRFVDEGGRVLQISSARELAFPNGGVIVDGLFGTGFKGMVREPFATIIDSANRSGVPIVAVDIPSGLNGQNGLVEGEVINATMTAFLGLPKAGFFLNDGWDCIGKLRYVNFGLPNDIIENSQSEMRMLIEDEVRALLPPLKRSRHKYQAGYVCAVAGSPSYSGAAILTSWAALRTGAGIVRLFYPDGTQHELCGSPVELIKTPYHYNDMTSVVNTINKSSAVLIGPGIGLSDEMRSFILQLLPQIEVPCVIDADALTIISKENVTLPERTILTPHHGEMMRLLQSEQKVPLNEDLLDRCKKYSEEKQVTLVLKGGPTFIFHPGQPITVNPTGDPGMATAGSGDVLTGVLAGLLAQGLYPQHAAQLGVFLHGLSGEFAAAMESSYSMTASDIADFLAEAYLRLQ